MKMARDEWMRDVRARQRNTVFPDTVQNEARLWRTLFGGGRQITFVGIIGAGLLIFALAFSVWMTAALQMSIVAPRGSVFARVIAAFGNWVIVLVVLGILFLFLRWRIRRALLSGRHRDRVG